MSRKWERMVEKNRKTINKQRTKTGKREISAAVKSKPDADRFLGRSYMLPALLIGLALVYMIAFYDMYSDSRVMYWLTGGAYLLLGVMLYIRRPYLNVGKSHVSTRGLFGSDKQMQADNIKKISFYPSYVMIEFKSTKRGWMFSRSFNRYDVEAIKTRLTQFARTNAVELNNDNQQGPAAG